MTVFERLLFWLGFGRFQGFRERVGGRWAWAIMRVEIERIERLGKAYTRAYTYVYAPHWRPWPKGCYGFVIDADRVEIYPPRAVARLNP